MGYNFQPTNEIKYKFLKIKRKKTGDNNNNNFEKTKKTPSLQEIKFSEEKKIKLKLFYWFFFFASSPINPKKSCFHFNFSFVNFQQKTTHKVLNNKK